MLSCPKKLKADLADNLKPVPETVKDIPVVNAGSTENFFCTDRQGAEKIAVAFRENSDCHAQLKSGPRDDLIGIILIGVGSLAAGFVIGQAMK